MFNLYHVTGRVEFNTRTKIPNLDYGPRYVNVNWNIEAETEEAAADKAFNRAKETTLKTWRTAYGFTWDNWNDGYTVEFLRTISEAEQMERIGAPKLF